MKSFFSITRRTRTREVLTLWGAGVLLPLLFLLLAIDALLFYRTLRPQGTPPESLSSREPVLTAEELNEVIRLLDEREQKFRELLAK